MSSKCDYKPSRVNVFKGIIYSFEDFTSGTVVSHDAKSQRVRSICNQPYNRRKPGRVGNSEELFLRNRETGR